MAPPTGSLRVGRYFLSLLAILVLLYTIVFWPGGRHTPKLGIDLVGGTEVVFTAVAPHGHSVSSSSMSQAKQIMTDRVNGTGVTEATVVIQGTDQLVVSIPGKQANLAALGQAAKLNFRPLVAPAVRVACTVATTKPSTSPSTTPSTSKSPSSSTTPSSGTSTTPAGSQPSSSAHSGAGFDARPLAATPSTSPSTSKTPSKTPSGSATPTGSTTPTPTPTSTAPATAPKCSTNPIATVAAAGKFKVPLTDTDYLKLSSSNQQLVQAALADYNCGAGQTETDDPKTYFIACDGGGYAHLLGPVVVAGTQISTASAQAPNSSGTGGSAQWTVQLTLKGSGPSKWATWTHNHNIGGATPSLSNSVANCGPSGYACADYVAFTLDGVVISAPVTVSTINTPQTSISGGFTEKSATQLANQLKYGALPLTFRADDAQTISATLGSTQLKAGLLAGGIGLALVIIYTLFYYRALGLVTISSLLVSGALTYGCLVMLASQIGFTLSLAGIAGFIVAIGITADSFVVFFERIKDEVHEGRSARVAIPRAWVRARRTILSADTVSFLAAAILYYFAAGDVKGFAFTLGLSTILDLVVVFLFTHPLVSYLSKFRAFGSRRFTGLDAVRGGPAISDVTLPAPGRRVAGKAATASTSVAVLEGEDDIDQENDETPAPAPARIVLNKADIEKTASASAATSEDAAAEVDDADVEEERRHTDPEPGSAAERAAARQAKLREERRNQKGKS